MSLISNFESLAVNKERNDLLHIIEAGLEAISPANALGQNFTKTENRLTIKDRDFDISGFDRIFLVGIGKGSAQNSQMLEKELGDTLTAGWVIDVEENPGFSKIEYTKGTHPVPSDVNKKFAEDLFNGLSELSDRDLVLFIICGGGSALLFKPEKISADRYISVTKDLLRSGANIEEVNTIRKHLDAAKGGGMAKILYPATVVGLVFSDVLGDNLSIIASGPLTLDEKTIDDAKAVSSKYGLDIDDSLFVESVKDEMYFEKVHNIMILTNEVALYAMQEKANELGIKSRVYSRTLSGEASRVGRELIDACESGEILLAGGETTVTVHGDGKGGRNQEFVLGALMHIKENCLVASVNSDGWDNTDSAGALGDALTLQKAKDAGVLVDAHLANNDSYGFFEKTGDAIKTGRLPSNVSDIMMVYKP